MSVLNLGCGSSKITGATNVDVNPITKCELVFDIKKPFPLADESYDKVYLFHTIEHIEKSYRFAVLREIHRVLKTDGEFIVSYPEFSKILQNWLDNKNSDRPFWEATIYGRQLYVGDYHYCAMHTPEFIEHLNALGFIVEKHFPEPAEDCNTVVKCIKSVPLPTYEEILYREVYLR